MSDAMKATNIRFGGEELDRVRRRADRLGLSIQTYVHDVVIRDVDELETRFLAAADRSIARCAEAFAEAGSARQGTTDTFREDEAAAERELANADRTGTA